MDFYSILQEILSEKGLSIPEAARACGLSDSTLRSIITRKNKTVALEVAMKISKGLCVSLERLNGMKELGQKNNAMHPDERWCVSLPKRASSTALRWSTPATARRTGPSVLLCVSSMG